MIGMDVAQADRGERFETPAPATHVDLRSLAAIEQHHFSPDAGQQRIESTSGQRNRAAGTQKEQVYHSERTSGGAWTLMDRLLGATRGQYAGDLTARLSAQYRL